MKKPAIVILILHITFLSFSQDSHSKLLKLRSELHANLTQNLLPYWSEYMVDNENGGFYGQISASNKVSPEAEKGGILNARILWTYSAAYRVTGDTSYLRLAKRARDYAMNHFIDKEHGGAYRSVTYKGEPLDMRKQTYTQAFFIYGLSEYARATGDKESVDAAKSIFECFEKYALDREYNGYFEVYSSDWKRIRDKLISERTDADEKTMNTSLHLMEAYANLYRVWPDKRMEERLRNIVEVFIDRIVDKRTYHLINFMDRQWNSTSQIDSYGHNIEASWLLYEAAGLLKDPALLERVRQVSIRIADAAAEGLMPDGSMINDKDNATGEVHMSRSWWPQAETVVGYVNAYELTGKEKYLDYAMRNWEYINKYFVDHKNGGWFTSVNEAGQPGRGEKGGYWVGPYHNGRMCLEIIERVKK
jgi:mannobiose 2-epimerase